MNTTFPATVLLAALAATTAYAQEPGSYGHELAYSDEFETSAYATTDGERLYRTHCAGCHMPDGSGAQGAGKYPALRENPNLEYAAYPVSLIVNGQQAMPAFGSMLNDEQIVALTAYIQENLGNGYEPDVTPQLVADTRPYEEAEESAEHQTEVAEDVTAQGNGGVIRHPIPNSDFPILQAVEIPADADLVYLSGTVPQVIDESAAADAPARFGDTAAQTVSTFESITAKLEMLGLDMGDVVKLQVYLVAPDGSDAMDFAGFMDGYVQFFGTEKQPNLPTRSVFEVAGLANPSWLVEIEAIAVRE
ncbi:Rid family hydrolase [Sulfitobacter sp. F26169L]|uniref:Rid family hydrolase n=1 Tax=Sulfitobacter sp. F26169L TaxID=2996015 RepID=UPI002260F614|nr:Rid family hydrolase [Sulfitobacter sp. F26169L]MCX7567473.1 Rid family hydrolase [Sulfitobacter sp. F26169L]